MRVRETGSKRRKKRKSPEIPGSSSFLRPRSMLCRGLAASRSRRWSVSPLASFALRQFRRSAGSPFASFALRQFEPSGRLRNRALSSSRGIPMNQSLSRRAIEEFDGSQLRGLAGSGRPRFLDRRPQGGSLRAVTHGGRACLAHVFLGGRDIRHENDSPKSVKRRCSGEGLKLEFNNTKVKAA